MRWWSVVGGCLVVGAILVVAGFWLFEARGFLENLIAETIGLAFALGIVVWLIEGPILTRERRLRAVLEYKWKVFQRTWEIGHMLAREIAEGIATDFVPPIDLHGEERGRWEAFRPLLREVFKRAREVPEKGLPAYASLDRETAHSDFKSCISMVDSIKEVIDAQPKLKDQVLPSIIALGQIESHIQRAERLGLIEDQTTRYEVVGELGDYVLDVVETIAPLPEGSRPW